MRNMKIFIVDDDPDFAEGIGMNLELDGHEVTYARGGEEAVRIFEEQKFDVTVMDVWMPGMNGIAALPQILAIKPDAKVVMVTAFSSQEVLTQAMESGASAVLEKPVTSRTLVDTFKKIRAAGIVLVVDDDPDFAEGIEAVLVGNGYSVVRAETGQAALETVLIENVDVLLLDIRLPDLNGLEVYTELKRLGRNLPTVVVTGFSEEESETLQELLRLSATGHLVKPIASGQLLQAIAEAL